jgi:glutaminyl-peptide cyclotransferase
MSNGSDTLVTRDPATFEITREVQITFQGHTLDRVIASNGTSFKSLFSLLNELECVDDAVYANVYLTDYILRIDQATGGITGIILASDLLTQDEGTVLSRGEVLNGIAYDAEKETFLLTGKHWPKLFEVQFNVTDTLNLNR